MKLKYEAPKGKRIKKQFTDIHVKGDMWWQCSTQEWVSSDSQNYDEKSCHSSHYSFVMLYGRGCPRSEKALIKYLKKHKELFGLEVTILTNWIGYNVTVDWEKN